MSAGNACIDARNPKPSIYTSIYKCLIIRVLICLLTKNSSRFGNNTKCKHRCELLCFVKFTIASIDFCDDRRHVTNAKFVYLQMSGIDKIDCIFVANFTRAYERQDPTADGL